LARLLISTVCRNSPPDVASGHLYVIDLNEMRVVQKSTIIEPAFKNNESNPRGGMRGAKGISIRQEEIALANSSMIFRYDPEWHLLGIITHPGCAYIHDISYSIEKNSIWVAAACADYLLEFDFSGHLLKAYNMREKSQALQAMKWNPSSLVDEKSLRKGVIDFRDPASHDHIVFDNAHINSLALLSDGEILVSMGLVIGEDFAVLKKVKMWMMKKNIWPLVLMLNNKMRSVLRKESKSVDNTLVMKPVKAQSAVVRITTTNERIPSLILGNISTPSHSLLTLPDQTAVYLNTSENTIIHFEPYSGRMISETPINKGFLRGICSLSDGYLAVGNRDRVAIFNLSTKIVSSDLTITNDVSEAIYDIKILPDHYRLPPSSFSEHLKQEIGINSAEEIIRTYGTVG